MYIRFLLTSFILSIGLANNLTKNQAAEAALFFIAFVLIILNWRNYKVLPVFGWCAAVLAALLVSASAPKDIVMPERFEAVVVFDTISTAYGSETAIRMNDGSKIKIWADRYPQYEAGDKVLVEAKASDKLRGYARGKISLLEKGGTGLYTVLTGLRREFKRFCQAVLPEPHSVFGAGTIVGGADGLPEKTKDQFAAAGISHILAASGYNFAILLVFLGYLLRPLSIRAQMLAFVVIIPCFAIVAGATSAVLRAALMGGLVCLAVASGRAANVKTALLWAGAILLARDPTLISFDLGFQLSFLATLGIVLINPLFEKLSRFWQGWRQTLAEVGITTISAQIATLPILSLNFGTVSTFGLLANLLVLPVIPLIMLGTFISVVVGLVIPLAGRAFGLLPWLAISYVFKIAELLGSANWSQVHYAAGRHAVLLFYFVLVAAILIMQKRFLRHKYEA